MPDWLILILTVPVVCGVIGWFTNVVAVKMIFRPKLPVKILGITFQGVLPKHQEHFARELAEVITGDFMTTSEMVARLDVEAVFEGLRPRLEALFPEIVAEIRGVLADNQQALLTDEVIDQLRDQIEQELRKALPEIRDELARRADELVDLTDVITEKVVAFGPGKLEEVIYRVARRELKFIEWYGGVFGFVIGLVQMGVIQVFPGISYGLPIVGAVVGMFTNYLAIQMLFYPREPKNLGLFKLQGLFPKRQKEMAVEQAKIAAEELIYPVEILAEMREQLIPDKVDPQLAAEIERVLTERYPMIAMTVKSMLLPEQQEAIKELLARRFIELGPDLAEEAIKIAAGNLDVEGILADKMANLSKLKFEQLLRGLFKQEELYLVLYGGLLGGIMGGVQLGAVILVK